MLGAHASHTWICATEASSGGWSEGWTVDDRTTGVGGGWKEGAAERGGEEEREGNTRTGPVCLTPPFAPVSIDRPWVDCGLYVEYVDGNTEACTGSDPRRDDDACVRPAADPVPQGAFGHRHGTWNTDMDRTWIGRGSDMDRTWATNGRVRTWRTATERQRQHGIFVAGCWRLPSVRGLASCVGVGLFASRVGLYRVRRGGGLRCIALHSGEIIRQLVGDGMDCIGRIECARRIASERRLHRTDA